MCVDWNDVRIEGHWDWEDLNLEGSLIDILIYLYIEEAFDPYYDTSLDLFLENSIDQEFIDYILEEDD
jgi:hypothetical protein